MVIPPVVVVVQRALAVSGASEFATPDDQRFIEHAPLLKVGN